MENVTLSQFLALAGSGFTCGFIIGLVRWGVRMACSSIQYGVTCRS